MGTIRLLLALGVALFHSYGIFSAHDTFTGGLVSVQTFYIISGFYMAMILTEKYKPGKGSYRLFISSRFLRIFPAYWATLIIVLLVSLAGKIFWNEPFYLWYWTSQWAKMSILTIVVLIFTNLFLFGSDGLLFTGMNRTSGQLELTQNPYAYRPMTFQYLLIPQIWSVGVELSFYLLAPFLLRSKWYLQLTVLLLSLGLRYYLYHYKWLVFDPWTYRFFPNEIAFFMAGSLAYRAYCWLRTKNIRAYIPVIFWAGVAAAVVFYPHLPVAAEPVRRWYFYSFFLLALPFVFIASKNSRIDRFIGELSFPVYIGHHFIMFLWRKYFFSHAIYMDWFGIVTALSSVVFAILLWFAVISPIEKYRQRRFVQKTALM